MSAAVAGKHPGRKPDDGDNVQAALKLVEVGLSPTKAAYSEVAAAGVIRKTP
jgi:hypothetical protein